MKSLLRSVLLLLVFLPIAACASDSHGGGVGAVMSFEVGDGHGGRPQGVARWNGNTTVAWASGSATAEVFAEMSGFPLYGPLQIKDGRAVVRVKDPEFEWEGDAMDPLPMQARRLFRQSEIDAWGLTFFEEDDVTVDPTVEVPEPAPAPTPQP